MHWFKNKIVSKNLVLLFLIVLITSMTSSCAYCSEGRFKKIRYKEIESGPATKIKDGKVIFPPNHIFDPKTSTIKEVKDKKLFGGVLLNDGRIFSVYPIVRHPSEQVRNDLRYKIYLMLKNDGMKISYDFHDLSVRDKEKIFLPHLKKHPELLKEYNEALELYEKSMYPVLSNPETGEYEYTGRLNIRRNGTYQFLLDDGRVLIIGGWPVKDYGAAAKDGNADFYTKHWQVEIFNPKTGKVTLLKHTKTPSGKICNMFKLDNDRFFIMTGHNYFFYDVKTNKFSKEKPFLPKVRVEEITKLNDGRLLFFVNLYNDAYYPKTEDIYDISKFKNTKSQQYYYENKNYSSMDILIYDPKTDKFSYSGHLAEPRSRLTSCFYRTALLKDGRVLIYGGLDPFYRSFFYDGRYLKTAEIYDPKTKISTPIRGKIHYERRDGDNSILLDDGRLLLFYDYNGVASSFDGVIRTVDFELYIPKGWKKN